MSATRVFTGGRIFDGKALREGLALVAEDDRTLDILPECEVHSGEVIPLNGDILCPAFVDVQVNGGGGVLFNDAPTQTGLAAIAEAHRKAGTGTILPTLITDTPQKTQAAIDAVAKTTVSAIAGLHLEGPHLAPEKAGAHDPALIRPMEPEDLNLYIDAARRLPRILITLAPEAATPDQISALASAGVKVSLGHSAATYDEAMAAFDAGATMSTHLFNAMGPLNHRDPGLAGATLDAGPRVAVGIIADGLHVHPAMIGLAFRAKKGPRNMFIVSDAMAPFGTDLETFRLNGRAVTVDGNRLALADGTLAGANSDLLSAVRLAVEEAGIPLVAALRMVTQAPALAARLPAPAGQLVAGGPLPLRIEGDLLTLRALSG